MQYGTRAFGHADESGNNTGILVPLAELINHSDSPNAHRTREQGGSRCSCAGFVRLCSFPGFAAGGGGGLLATACWALMLGSNSCMAAVLPPPPAKQIMARMSSCRLCKTSRRGRYAAAVGSCTCHTDGRACMLMGHAAWLHYMPSALHTCNCGCLCLLVGLQELTINYQPGIIHRPDLSLYIYGQLAR